MSDTHKWPSCTRMLQLHPFGLAGRPALRLRQPFGPACNTPSPKSTHLQGLFLCSSATLPLEYPAPAPLLSYPPGSRAAAALPALGALLYSCIPSLHCASIANPSLSPIQKCLCLGLLHAQRSCSVRCLVLTPFLDSTYAHVGPSARGVSCPCYSCLIHADLTRPAYSTPFAGLWSWFVSFQDEYIVEHGNACSSTTT
jgi:hypothetical protein